MAYLRDDSMVFLCQRTYERDQCHNKQRFFSQKSGFSHKYFAPGSNRFGFDDPPCAGLFVDSCIYFLWLLSIDLLASSGVLHLLRALSFARGIVADFFNQGLCQRHRQFYRRRHLAGILGDADILVHGVNPAKVPIPDRTQPDGLYRRWFQGQLHQPCLVLGKGLTDTPVYRYGNVFLCLRCNCV